MRKNKYEVKFVDSLIYVRAFNEFEASILAQAIRIKEGKLYDIINIRELKL